MKKFFSLLFLSVIIVNAANAQKDTSVNVNVNKSTIDKTVTDKSKVAVEMALVKGCTVEIVNDEYIIENFNNFPVQVEFGVEWREYKKSGKYADWKGYKCITKIVKANQTLKEKLNFDIRKERPTNYIKYYLYNSETKCYRLNLD